MSNSQRTIANLEELLRNVEEEKHGLMLDLSAARDLCSHLESSKDGLQRQLVSKALDQEKVFTLLLHHKQFFFTGHEYNTVEFIIIILKSLLQLL